MIRTARRALAGFAISAGLLAAAAPAAHADDPWILINVPNEAFPYIGVAPWLHDAITDRTPSINDGVVDLEHQNDATVRGVAGGGGNLLCVISGFFGSPCQPVPHA